MRSKKWTALFPVLLLCLQLCGCRSIMIAQPAPTLIPNEPVTEEYTQPMRAFTRTVGMYFPGAETMNPERRPVEIVCEEGMWLPEVLVRSLLEPVDNASLYSLFAGTGQLVSMSSCKAMLIVELDYDENLSQKELSVSLLSIARTLSSETSAKSVLFLHNGVRIPLSGAISNPISREDGLSDEIWAIQKDYMETGHLTEITSIDRVPQYERQLLFYPDISGRYVLCEETEERTRKMSAQAIRDLITREPESQGVSAAVCCGVKMESFVREDSPDGGKNLVKIRFSRTDPGKPTRGQLEMLRDLCVWNLRANDSTIDAVEIYLGDQLLNDLLKDGHGSYSGEESRDRFGETVKLYFYHTESGCLKAVERVLSFGESISPESWLRALLEGPDLYEDEDLLPVFPEGIMQEDLLNVETDGMNAVLDFSSAFETCYPLQDERMERMMIYAVVNTMTEDTWIQRVLFRVEGQQLDTLGGNLYLGNPLVRNPGLIEESSDQE